MQVDLFKEEDIIKGCQRGERKYQEVLYRRFSSRMYALCLGYAGNRSLAQDILHDSFLKIFKTITTYTNQGSLEGWVRRIVTNTAIDQMRKTQRLEKLIPADAENINAEQKADAASLISTKEILEQVSRLPDGARTIFNLFALEGLTHKEIAVRLSISEGTSKSQYNRARNLLMQWVEKP